MTMAQYLELMWEDQTLVAGSLPQTGVLHCGREQASKWLLGTHFFLLLTMDVVPNSTSCHLDFQTIMSIAWDCELKYSLCLLSCF